MSVGTLDLITTLTILNTQTQSQVLSLAINTDREIMAITFFSPATLPEVVNIFVAPTVSGTFRMLQSDGTDIALPAAKATTITHLVAGGLRLVATGAAGADRVFDVCIRFGQRWKG